MKRLLIVGLLVNVSQVIFASDRSIPLVKKSTYINCAYIGIAGFLVTSSGMIILRSGLKDVGSNSIQMRKELYNFGMVLIAAGCTMTGYGYRSAKQSVEITMKEVVQRPRES